MRLSMNMPHLAKAFVLSTGLAFTPLLAYAQDALPEPDGANLSLSAQDADYPDVEALLKSSGIADAEVSAAMEVMYQNIFRVSRGYIRPVGMEELERSIYAGIQFRIENRDERMEKANSGVQDATQALEALRLEHSSLQEAATPIPAALGDQIIEADLSLRAARLELRRAEIYQNINGEALINAGLEYAFKGLDPHTKFHLGDDPLAMAQLEDEAPPAGAGIGAVIEVDGESDYVLERGVRIKSVMAPEDNTPAFRANLKPGDIITHVDNESLAGLLLKDARNMLLGTPGSPASLKVINEAGEERTVRLARAVTQLKNVTHRIVGGNIAYMHIDAFMNDQVTEDIIKAIEDIQTELGGPDNVAGYVISVRDNGGGLLTEVVELNNLFINGEDFDHSYGVDVPEEVLRRNAIVTTRNREGMDERFLSQQGDFINGKPLIVLTNGGSASASEIFAGTIQEYRGITLGITTFGKGTVQVMSGGPGGVGSLKYTISEYTYGPGGEDTPMGFSVQHHGIVPNVYTPFEPLYEISEAGLKNSILSDGRRTVHAEPDQTCAKVGEESALMPGTVANGSFIDPRTNEFDFILNCAAMVIKGQLQTEPQRYLEVRPYSPSDVPAVTRAPALE